MLVQSSRYKTAIAISATSHNNNKLLTPIVSRAAAAVEGDPKPILQVVCLSVSDSMFLYFKSRRFFCQRLRERDSTIHGNHLEIIICLYLQFDWTFVLGFPSFSSPSLSVSVYWLAGWQTATRGWIINRQFVHSSRLLLDSFSLEGLLI